ncbi:unnamed protein product [Rotaria sordida]|uniref:Abasic site processing protein HMCES n=1 Tax=Rotaria sordida TaxID=392033 RepID=A0A815E8C6_9BILA|nr:unnamed protein product [Rotaria sordida]CAF1307921.1 unnamed protein product [Rotaria sordida]
MCDRLCIAFSLKELQGLIQLKDTDTMIGPNYVELGTKLKPIQTYNALRNSPCPILLSEKHIYDGIPSNSIVLAIMQWGLLPSWKIEDKTKLKYRIANVKKEKLNKIKTFQTLLKKGHRCVLVCEGFYQFISLNNKLDKQVYFIHLNNIFDKRKQCEIIRPCYIAALFDTFKQSDGQEFYSFCIITVNTPTNLSHTIASYMPAIFNSIEQALDWIDFDRIDMNEALKLLENHEEYLVIDLVSNYVLKRSNTGPECIAVISEPTIEKSSTTNIESEDDIDRKVLEKHMEDIEQQQHENQITHLINENEAFQQKKRHYRKSSNNPGIKYDENKLKTIFGSFLKSNNCKLITNITNTL